MIPGTDLPSTPAETGEPIEETAAETLTPAPQPTATGTDIPLTPTPSLTATFTPYPTPPGLLTYEELEQRMQDWISGEIEFTDEDRLLDEKTGEVLKLGVLDTIVRSVTFVFYNLGFGLLEDQEGNPYLINLVGFEDGKANRFTTIFHNGKLDDGEAIIRLAQHRGRRINQGEKISFEQLLPEEFANMCVDLPMSAYVGSTFTEGATGRETWYRYLDTAKDGATALRDFLLCEDCSAEDPPDILKPLINSIPEKYSEDIPYFFDYHVSIW
ncbi:MAG: hypothetical protein AAGU75_16385 [Bacillota bacterium]